MTGRTSPVPDLQAHWLVNKAGGSVTYTKLYSDADGGCIIEPGRIRSVHANKRNRYIWGNSWTTSKGTQTIFWVTQNHGFLYECRPYDRAAHLAYARYLALLIAANTWYIYLNGERFEIPRPDPERYLYVQSVVLHSRPIAPKIQDDPEWQYPSRGKRWETLDSHCPVSPASSYSSVISLADLFDTSKWVVNISKGSDTRSVCSESDVRDERLGSKRTCDLRY